ncbi:MAG TPA: Gfo/Idh/MocA family oxidoreductase [Bacteroidales bacterium]|nr:Gfo/Idh/MocA family oxidoreductase [Bacteroidales bacterium]HPF02576.1 Gfo/Idh/MocA family oxidoreductase [Bacteroidales bacterium]HPJ59283.1 Gfo/Idh/MocA family oxidoreductase [Bacteroidales bacterium]HPR11039.1 Gfo/Idh/MocA family oxidoreductase [Bacteroidales bacterium]HRW84434.1 Gfo/Idh/MocA family oxidoreductase [Bacteroidales bacterium]
MGHNRRTFVRRAAAGAAAVSLGGILPGFGARSYSRIAGSNEKISISVMGVNSRGLALARSFARQKDVDVIFISDVDSRAASKCCDTLEKLGVKRPEARPDFRKGLESRDLDALVIAAPDHWHAPAALLALKAGKHVYLEKPCSHNPAEGELLVEAVKKYEKTVQMGNQRRSFPRVIQGIEELRNGIIGRPYFAKTWYTNNRASIGKGKETPVPDWLDYQLWQGPAPEKPFRDNLIHYNWHWFWNWGTGEALNNGTHFVDIARWGLGVDYPVKVTSTGGRYRYDDDWETPDTQVITMEFGNNTAMCWEGLSCNGRPVEGSTVGVIFSGEEGALQINGGDEYFVYDLKGKLVKEVSSKTDIDSRNTSDPSAGLDSVHIRNFLDAIKTGAQLRSDIESGHKSTLLVQLGNIAQRTGFSLDIDPADGHILKNRKAQKLWTREYEPGWEPSV